MKNYNANLLKNNWTKIKRKIILPLWFSKYKPMYESLKLDYDDFESMAGEELTKAISTYVMAEIIVEIVLIIVPTLSV